MKTKKIDENTIEIDGVRYIREDNSKWLHIPELKMYIEIEVHDKGKSWDELGLTYGDKKLLKYDEVVFLANSKYSETLKMDGSSSKDDFYFDQPFELNKKNKLVAGFSAGSDDAVLYCVVNSGYSDSARGVRFCRRYE